MNKSFVVTLAMGIALTFGLNSALAQCPLKKDDCGCEKVKVETVCDECQKNNCDCAKKCPCKDDCKCKEDCGCKKACKCGENCTCSEDCGCKKDCGCKDDCDCKKTRKHFFKRDKGCDCDCCDK